MRKYYNINNYQNNDDKLRGHIGFYPALTGSVRYHDNKITHYVVEEPVMNSNKLFPTIRQKVYIYSDESTFRDGIQWTEHVNSLIVPNLTYIDHSFSINEISTECKIRRTTHIPKYEDLGKSLDTRALMNYNIAYTTSQSNLIDDMATLRNEFDGDLFYGDFGAKANSKYLKTVIDNYQERLNLSAVGLDNIIAKNENIYKINKRSSERRVKINNDVFPCHVEITSNHGVLRNNSLIDILEEHNYEKLIFQAINNSSVAHYIEFQGNSLIRAHDVVDLFNNLDFKNFQEKENELFLLREEDSVDNLVNRFINQINSIKVLEKINQLIQADLRDYKQITDTILSERYNLGYKIEKYLNNTNGSPIQTYYIKNDENYLEHIDTQLKFGVKYVYKIYNISCVLGSSYQYENVDISSQEDNVTVLNANYDTSYAFRASADISVVPSMKILEIPLYTSEKMFFDVIPPKPWVDFSLSPTGVMIRFEPMGYDQLEEFEFQPIHPDESYINSNLKWSSDGYSQSHRGSEYFKGDYKIYRLTTPPQSLEEFYNAPSKLVDNFLEIVHNNRVDLGSRPIEKVKMLHASHDDKILPNKKYYYIFRAVSYHGTESNPTEIYEVEIVKTASDRLLKVKLHEFKTHTDFKKIKSFKRLLKVEPDFAHWATPWADDFEGGVEEAMVSIGIPGKRLFSDSGNIYKIRLTSKHTGKKIDLNVNFKIIKKTN